MDGYDMVQYHDDMTTIHPDYVGRTVHGGMDLPFLTRVLDAAEAAEHGRWFVLRGPFARNSATPRKIAWLINVGRKYVSLVAGRSFEFRSWIDPNENVSYVLVRRAPQEREPEEHAEVVTLGVDEENDWSYTT